MSSGGMLYGGDEIGALVFDPGHHSFRVGYAQVSRILDRFPFTRQRK
jgi:hypothetical protein